MTNGHVDVTAGISRPRRRCSFYRCARQPPGGSRGTDRAARLEGDLSFWRDAKERERGPVDLEQVRRMARVLVAVGAAAWLADEVILRVIAAF